MDNIINFDLISHPANWLIIILMIWVALIGFHEFHKFGVLHDGE